MDRNNSKIELTMKTVYVYIYICICMIFCSCVYTKWDDQTELIGEWEAFSGDFCAGARISLSEDGTCKVSGIPTYKMLYSGKPHPTLRWEGSELFKEKYSLLESWDFSGYWKLEEDTISDLFSIPSYKYSIRMSPHKELLGTKQERDSFMNSTNAEDAFWVKIYAITQSVFFPPAHLQYLYFEVVGPDDDYSFHKLKQ